MKIVVLVKQVPDTYGERTLSLETGLADRNAENVIDEINERALELALSHSDAHEGTEVVALCVGPAEAEPDIRKCLAMGANTAVHIVDEGMIGADLGLTAEVLAAALKRVGYDLIVTGNQSTDGMGGVLPAMLAERLGVANITNLDSVVIGDSEVSGRRSTDDAELEVRAALPAVVSVTEQMPEARFPNFKGIMAAKKKHIETLSLSDLSIDADDLTSPRAIMTAIAERPPRAEGVRITDEGDAGVRLAAFLAENRLI